ncbi:AAA family ATPase [Bradyrhizobium sp. 173]|uniref:ATP-dependent nuclease n=1 Tax=Bradyrhizobium sp. 173 TaxID=2782644 RepID=UPI001FFA4D90|nr:AAA family ATPase [Bradyrhizobium sp. 173]MCK1562810.1 AAA family ATPase [Bradyrhizobium sp. 173]
MKVSRVKVENFRSILSLDLRLGDTTVFIGANNAGKSAILDAVRIVLTRRWGQRGTGFTEDDVHKSNDAGDPRTLPPVTVTLFMEEPSAGAWDADMVAALEDIIALTPDGQRNLLTLRVTCAWNEPKESFDPVWQFLDSAGELLPERRRSINLTGFFSYMPLFWLGALRDAADEFTPRSGYWGKLLRGIRIPAELETDALRILGELDARIVAADPRLAQIADLIGHSTRVAVGEGPGAAKLATLPMTIEEMLQRTGIIIRNEHQRPWLPLSQHGQGLQSLAVIFLFQAAVLQQLAEAERPGVEAVFAIEEPEAHLHPQAARTLWARVCELSGQKLLTTHSPYFVQHVPLRDLRLVCLRGGHTVVESLPEHIVSVLPWNDSVEGIARGAAGRVFFKDTSSGRVAARSWFSEDVASSLAHCYRRDTDAAAKIEVVSELRHSSRILPSAEDEAELGFHCRRERGEIFFARRWIMVEGVTEYLLLHAIGKALGWPLDDNGVAVIDFTQSGSAGVYPALAEAFKIPWHMITDGDGESAKFRGHIVDRGFTEAEIETHFRTLLPPNDLEDQLLADGHEQLLRDILGKVSGPAASTLPPDEFKVRLKKNKTGYMSVLATHVAADPVLAARMPVPFVTLLTSLRDGHA